MECPNCKTPNADVNVFCLKCGKNLTGKVVCPECGAYASSEGEFCHECGNKMQPSNTNEAGQIAADMFKQAKTLAGMGVAQAKNLADKGVEQAKSMAIKGTTQPEDDYASATDFNAGPVGKFAKLFKTPDEKLVSVIGNSYLEQFLSNSIIAKGFAVLSDKRVYIASEAFGKRKKIFAKATERHTIDIEDITHTGYQYISPFGYYIAMIISVLFGIVAKLANGRSVGGTYALVIGLIAGLIFLFLYLKNRESIYIISFPGGEVGLPLRWLKQSEFEKFDRHLRLVKDAKRSKDEGGK